MSSETPRPERIVVDFPKTEIADEKTRRSVLRLAVPLVLLPHVAQEFWLHSLLQRGQRRGRPALRQHRRAALLDGLVADDGLLLDLRVHVERYQPAVQRRIMPGMVYGEPPEVASLAVLAVLQLGPAGRLAGGVELGWPGFRPLSLWPFWNLLTGCGLTMALCILCPRAEEARASPP